MIEIRPISEVSGDDLRRLIAGYVSDFKYAVERRVDGDGVQFSLRPVPLKEPYRKRYDHVDAAAVAHYQRMVAEGFSFGAFESGTCVGIALVEAKAWNRSLTVCELHAAETHQRRGIGRRLLDAVSEKARTAGYRVVVCETQNTNGPAMRFYLRLGFELEGLDLSLYRNTDYPDGEIAFILKRKIEP